MDPRRRFGNKAENLAARFLVSKGYKILKRQYRTRGGEIDLIALDGDEIVFIEVKARTTNEFGYPEESVTRDKLRKIQATAELYLSKSKSLNSPYRIEVVAVEYQKGMDPIITIVPVVEV
ncbi:YraN family protein [Candidatus Uhrbacteria bacterium]|jgi:putative endonuclease|nr:YraN family protein [Candidatus Uhrbacteria bacterium]MBT7716878.1 YraN family protein [Candidatus Uhrbacteria bacterium]